MKVNADVFVLFGTLTISICVNRPSQTIEHLGRIQQLFKYILPLLK